MNTAGHNEVVCHTAGERRQNYLNQIKCILDKMDDTPCVQDRGGNVNEDSTARPLIEYPGYVNRLNPKFNKAFHVPLITNIAVKQIRPTSNLAEHIHENCRDLEYVQAELLANPHAPMKFGNKMRANSLELRGGYIIQGCDCVRHNGLQDKCQRIGCNGSPACLTEPPTCAPANTLAPAKPQKGLNEIIADAVASHPAPKLQYCCCTPGCGNGQGPDNMYSKEQLPNNFVCYPCTP